MFILPKNYLTPKKMTEDNKLISELNHLNKKLDFLSRPAKIIWFNFYSGVFQALGHLFGTLVVAALLVYLLSKININQLFSAWLQNLIQNTIDKITL